MAWGAVQPQDLLRLPLQDRRRDGRSGVPSMCRPGQRPSSALEEDPWAGRNGGVSPRQRAAGQDGRRQLGARVAPAVRAGGAVASRGTQQA